MFSNTLNTGSAWMDVDRLAEGGGVSQLQVRELTPTADRPKTETHGEPDLQSVTGQPWTVQVRKLKKMAQQQADRALSTRWRWSD